MDQLLSDYLDSLVQDILNNIPFNSLLPPDRQQKSEQIYAILYQVIFDLTIDHLPDSQIMELSNLQMGSPEMLAKLEGFASTVPDLASMIEQKLLEKVAEIKQDPSIVQ